MAARTGGKKKAALSIVDSKAVSTGVLETGKKNIENWANKPESAAYKAAADLYSKIQQCYQNKEDQSDKIDEYWNIFNATPDTNQQYIGNSTCYIPAVRDAVKARAKRCLKQLFPVNHRHVDATGPTGEIPYPQLAILEHYISKTDLEGIVRSDLIAGDVTGQWNLYLDWTKSYRRITEVVTKNPILEHTEDESIEIEDQASEPDEETKTRDVLTEGPDIIDFSTQDLAVYPPTVNDIDKAEATSLRLRMSKEKLKQMVDAGIFIVPEKSDLQEFLEKAAVPDAGREKKNPDKSATEDAGIKNQGTLKYCLVYEVFTMLDFEDAPKGEKNIKQAALVYFTGPNQISGIIKAPWWGGRDPKISAPVERRKGSFFGMSLIEPVKFLQWNLNDFWNMGQDSAQYSLLPIIAADPIANPNWARMVIGLAAVWPIKPEGVKFMEFPALWKDAIPLCDTIERRIWQSLDVNEMMLGKMPSGRKNNQMMGNMQQEQQINITDNATRYEKCILNKVVERMFEYDQQFRTHNLTVTSMGETGVRANQTEIEPQQYGIRYRFQWAGTSYMMGMQRMQQQIGFMNVLRGTPPQLLNGRRLDLTPIINAATENIFGPELTPHILIDDRNQFTIDPATENEMIHNGLATQVHAGDDDIEHIKAHMQAAQLTGDPVQLFKQHIQMHAAALQQKRQMAMMQQQQQQGGGTGAPGGGAAPGIAGTPKPGAIPAQPRPQGPPGQIHADQAADGAMPGRG